MTRAYLLLAVAIVAEVIVTSALKASQGFTRLAPSLVVVAGYGIAFYCLSRCLAAGMNVGVRLRGIKADEIRRGQVLAAPKSIRPRVKFRAEVYALRKDEGGRHNPFFAGYKPQFYVRTTDVTGVIALPEDRGKIVIAVFIKKSAAPMEERERAIAEIARAVYDYYLFAER